MPGPFVYQGNIPQATDQLSVSQSDILTNFASIESLIDIDHVDFSSANAGQHNKISLPLIDTYPALPLFAVGTVGLYNFTSPTSGINELYINKNVAGGGTAIFPITLSTFSNTALPAAGSEWFSNLPSGLLLKGGGLVSQAPTTHLFPVAANIPVFSQVLTILYTINSPSGGTGFVTNVSVSTVGFTFTLSAGFPVDGTINYLVIGY